MMDLVGKTGQKEWFVVYQDGTIRLHEEYRFSGNRMVQFFRMLSIIPSYTDNLHVD
jgi:hypothetical protein